jgi:hypothetical protein
MNARAKTAFLPKAKCSIKPKLFDSVRYRLYNKPVFKEWCAKVAIKGQ